MLFVVLLFFFDVLLSFRVLYIVCLCLLFVCGVVGWFVWVVCGFIRCVLFVCVYVCVVVFSIARTTQYVFPFASVNVLAHAS